MNNRSYDLILGAMFCITVITCTFLVTECAKITGPDRPDKATQNIIEHQRP